MLAGAQRAAAGNSAIQRSGGSLQHTRSRYDSDLEDEVEEDDEEGGPVEDWRAELQKITGYDPSRCAWQRPRVGHVRLRVQSLQDLSREEQFRMLPPFQQRSVRAQDICSSIHQHGKHRYSVWYKANETVVPYVKCRG